MSWHTPTQMVTIAQGPDLQKILGEILSLSWVFPKFILSLSGVIKLRFAYIFACNLLKQFYNFLSSSYMYADNSVKRC